MKIDQRWTFLLALFTSAAAGAAFALRSRNRQHRAAHVAQHKLDLKSWENEGGNLAPAPASAVRP